MSICKVCGQEMRLIPAGVSKRTGEPYNAFMACPNKCKQPKEEPIPKTAVFAGNLAEDKRREDIEKAMEKKRSGINASVALNNAINLHKADATTLTPSEEVVLKTAEIFLKWLDDRTK